MMLDPLITCLVDRDIKVSLMRGGYEVEGFYKSGFLKLFWYVDTYICVDRYGDKVTISTFDELVHIHYRWWLISKDRFDGWAEPDSKWVDDYKRLNLI